MRTTCALEQGLRVVVEGGGQVAMAEEERGREASMLVLMIRMIGLRRFTETLKEI